MTPSVVSISQMTANEMLMLYQSGIDPSLREAEIVKYEQLHARACGSEAALSLAKAGLTSRQVGAALETLSEKVRVLYDSRSSSIQHFTLKDEQNQDLYISVLGISKDELNKCVVCDQDVQPFLEYYIANKTDEIKLSDMARHEITVHGYFGAPRNHIRPEKLAKILGLL